MQATSKGSDQTARIIDPRYVISNNVVFWHVYTQTGLCSLLLSLETPNDVQSVD